VQRLSVVVFAVAAILSACGGIQTLKADAGADFSVVMGAAPTFDGCASAGDIVNYKWTVLTAPPAMLSDVGKALREVDANCLFTLESSMHVEEAGEWVIQLEVRDASGNTATDTVTVTVTP